MAAFPVLPFGAIGLSGCSAADRSTPVEAGTAIGQNGCEWCGAAEAPANLSWQIVVAPASEPGERIRISGTIYQSDEVTPAEGIVIYVYHTNAQGVYPKNTPNDGRMSWRHGYLRGWMRTGSDGRYEFRTIKPAAYPDGREPAHIHITVSGVNRPEYYIEDFCLKAIRSLPTATEEIIRAAVHQILSGLNAMLEANCEARAIFDCGVFERDVFIFF